MGLESYFGNGNMTWNQKSCGAQYFLIFNYITGNRKLKVSWGSFEIFPNCTIHWLSQNLILKALQEALRLLITQWGLLRFSQSKMLGKTKENQPMSASKHHSLPCSIPSTNVARQGMVRCLKNVKFFRFFRIFLKFYGEKISKCGV